MGLCLKLSYQNIAAYRIFSMVLSEKKNIMLKDELSEKWHYGYCGKKL